MLQAAANTHTHTHIHTLSLTHVLSHSYSHTHTLPHTHTHTHTADVLQAAVAIKAEQVQFLKIQFFSHFTQSVDLRADF